IPNTHMFSHTSSRLKRVALLAVALVMAIGPTAALAASSWNPTLLVNTESFQTLDEGDGNTNIELRFGQTLNQKLYYDRSNNQFVFTNNLKVNGSITATGSIISKGLLSGASLRIDGSANVFGNLSATGALHIKGTTALDQATTIGGNTKVR